MSALNALLVPAADAVLRPLALLPPWLGVLVLALVTSLVLLAVVRWTSDQRALAAVKRQIHADLFEMRLYNDDLRGLLRAQGAVLRHNGHYLRLSLLPLLCTALPLGLAIAQIQAWYGYQGLALGQPVLVSTELREGVTPGVATLVGDGVEVDGPPSYFPSVREVVWRVVPTEAGPHALRLHVNGAGYDKALVAGDALARRSPLRPSVDVVDQFLEPSESPLDASGPVAKIRVPYPERSLDVFGWPTHWLVLYLAATFGCVLLLRRPLGVVI